MLHFKRRKMWFIGILTLILIGTVVWIIWGNTALTVTEYTVKSSKIPESFSGFRIVQVSDLHNAEFGIENKKLIDVLYDTLPDIIVMTGDLVDSRKTNIDIALFFAKQAVQIAPTYYVTGNHEARITDCSYLKTRLSELGVTVLENQCLQIEKDGKYVSLLGIDDPMFLAAGNETEATQAALGSIFPADGSYCILLAHRPEQFNAYVNCGVDLVFSGHAHGGQFRLPYIGGIFAPNQGFFPEYDSGLYTGGNTTMVVSRGIGNSLFPFRMNNRPEIVAVTIQTEET